MRKFKKYFVEIMSTVFVLMSTVFFLMPILLLVFLVTANNLWGYTPDTYVLSLILACIWIDLKYNTHV